jgi:hypothetical protein
MVPALRMIRRTECMAKLATEGGPVKSVSDGRADRDGHKRRCGNLLSSRAKRMAKPCGSRFPDLQGYHFLSECPFVGYCRSDEPLQSTPCSAIWQGHKRTALCGYRFSKACCRASVAALSRAMARANPPPPAPASLAPTT